MNAKKMKEMHDKLARDIDELNDRKASIKAKVAAAKAQEDMKPLMENADKEIILDCTKLEYVSSSGLRLFLTLRKETSAKGGKVIIENINEEIKKVFMMTGFFNLFDIR